ncbi:hypothetical protein DKM44_02545 [Deinococcus irradiatisoli]|uniref:Lipoprotein n=1 Tax=Deinococcus irradiatisoli TaxID=2202254 RepID=A0A2Z3JAW2_9DEIO|nr:hypothetical protein [Deinococcus irradiatisoli]AWN22253.1 hypothetical protein DKM44_02545 [Deinococcus irradiatisoli]
MRPLPLLLPLLLLSACSTMPTPDAPDPQKETRGSVPNWSGGAGTVKLVVEDQTLSSAPISAAGKFTLPLPTASVLTGLGVRAADYPAFAEGCTRDVQVSASEVRLVVVPSLDVQTAQGGVQTLSRFEQSHDAVLDASNSTQDLLVYASGETQIYGDVSCAATQKRASYSLLLRLNPGWNTVRLTQSLLNSTSGGLRAVTQFVSLPINVNTTWTVGSLHPLSR